MQIAEWLRQGGVFMWPILLCAVVGAAVAVERFLYVYLRAGINAGAFMAQVQRDVLDGNVEKAVRLCNGEPSAALPRVVKAGLVRADRPESEIRDAVEEATLEVFPQIGRRIAYLPMIANVSTLLGLLGTIQGLIISFHSVAEATAEARSTALAQGIAVAMYTTFFGLMVSIPLLVAHGVVSARANAILDDIDHYALKLVNLLNATRKDDERAGGGGAPVLPFPGS
ncbi:MAG: MotA/TolQ/ExbB proton channel family protein [Myxococcota bacterium]